MRFILLFLMLALLKPAFSSPEEIVRHLASLEFDSAWLLSQKLNDPQKREVFTNLTLLLSHDGQQKGDSILIAGILQTSDDPHDQLILGNYYLLNGERSKALTYLLKSFEHFKKSDDPLLTINYLAILKLYSRILVSEKFMYYLDEYDLFAEEPYMRAWHFIYSLIYYSKVLNTEEVASQYRDTYESARKFFVRNRFNQNLEAHYQEKVAVFLRWEQNFEGALDAFQTVVDYSKDKDYLKSLKFTALIELAGMQIKLGELQKAKINIERAKREWDYSDPVLSEINYNLVLALNYYEQLEQWDSAYVLIKQIFGHRLQSFIENNNVRLSELEQEFGVEIKDEKLLNQTIQIAQNQRYLILLSVLLLVTLLSAILLIYAFQKIRSKNQKIETLMRELHHRVKNNLQVISSLLGLQSIKLENESAKKAVIEGKGRIRAMSLIHQRLYQNDEVALLNIEDYIISLIQEIAQSYGYSDKVQISTNIDTKTLDSDTTLPLGLIINELVSNTFKYAYEHIENPMVDVILKPNKLRRDYLDLTIRDNGPGLPAQVELSQVESFGLRLVNLLVIQIKGEITHRSDHEGCTFQITFPERKTT